MEIDDSFEEWDEEELTDLLNEDEEEEDERQSDGEGESESETDEEDEQVLKCSKCNKLYHVLGWLKKHEVNCDGEKKKQSSKGKQLSEHQKHVQDVLETLGFDEYYTLFCIPTLQSLLEESRNVDEETVRLRGPRCLQCKLQASSLLPEVPENSFFKDISSKLWTICFSKDSLLRSSKRHLHIAREIHSFRNSQSLKTRWIDLNTSVGTVGDQLLLQRIITAVFGDICQYRKKALENVLQNESQSVNKPSLTSLSSVERDIVSYVGGYVCRKVRDRLQRYISTNNGSTIIKVKEKCCLFDKMMKCISSQMIINSTQTPAMTFPSIMTLSLTRGSLSHINVPTFTFFCYLELSIRPFLNLTKFRSSTRMSDSELLKQLIDNSNILKPAFPCSTNLTSTANILLIRFVTELYYRVRKWAYLKVYKENKKYQEKMAALKSSKSSKTTVSLHGKDSIRKALMNNNTMLTTTTCPVKQ